MQRSLIFRRYKYTLFLIPALLSILGIRAQVDSLIKKLPEILFKSYNIEQLRGTAISQRIDSLLHPVLHIGGYVSTYYAHYDALPEDNGFVLFPTLAPRSDQFSLNMALINFDYRSSNMRAAITLHYGDVPESSWPETFNLIQEARAGFKLLPGLWFDAGFFKTHIGLESFQPRENIASSMSIPNYYDPYYLSGVKLTYQLNRKWMVQVGAFNGYNEYLDNNKNKAFDFSCNYNPNRYLSITYNFLTCDESPDSVRTSHQRYYNNMYGSYTRGLWKIGIDLNFGLQENSLKSDKNKMALLGGAVLVAEYQLLKKLAVYGRGELFSDPSQVLTGKLNTGRGINGVTLGTEFKPVSTAGISLEWRLLQAGENIFRQVNGRTNVRNEFIICLDLWF